MDRGVFSEGDGQTASPGYRESLYDITPREDSRAQLPSILVRIDRALVSHFEHVARFLAEMDYSSIISSSFSTFSIH